MNYYLAIDLGASSGRHIIGYEENGEIKLEEIYRFPNGMINTDDGLTWDIESIYSHVKEGIKIALSKYEKIESLAIDTWGVDYVLMNGDKPIYPVYAYRNSRTEYSIPKVHEIMPFEKLYSISGIQFETFNTIYQLYWDKLKGRLDNATDFLFIPEYLTYLLTGVKAKEFTIASTSGMLNTDTKEFDSEIIKNLGLPEKLFGKLSEPGTFVGELKPELQKELGGNIDVLFCPSHDTASAFESIDTDDSSILISSGTWSIIGTKLKKASKDKLSLSSNFANEGGVGYFRYLKNIMGMWIVNQIQKKKKNSIPELVEMAKKSKFTGIFNANDPSIAAPEDMETAVINLLKKNYKFDKLSDGDLFNSVFLSLADLYKKVSDQFEFNLNKKFDKIYIVGGGAKNKYLNFLTEKATGKKIIALPIEATAIGNIKSQIRRK